MLTTSASVRFTVWANAVLAGGCDPDTAARRILGDDVGHQIGGLDGLDGPVTLPVALNLLRSRGARAVHLALPVPGDPAGLAGPPPFNEAALDAGEATIVAGLAPSAGTEPAGTEGHAGLPGFEGLAGLAGLGGLSRSAGELGVGLIPSYVGPAVQWTAMPARTPPPSDLGEADRGLRTALIEAAESLAALDVARWKPEIADELIDIRRIGSDARDTLAPGYDPRAVKTAATARRCLAIADAALADDGAAITGAEAVARREALTGLARAARQALIAACAPPTAS